MNNTFYFSHDYNARHDPKLIKLQMKHGMAGLGVFWCLLEMLYEQNGELETDYDIIAFEMRSHSDLIKSVVQDFDLFVISDNIFYSRGVKQRLAELATKSQKAKESAEKRWNKQPQNANALPPHSEPNAINEMKGNEMKGNEKREEEEALTSRIFEKTKNSRVVETVTAELIRHLGIETERLNRFLDWYDAQKTAWTLGNLKNLKFKIDDWIRFDEPTAEQAKPPENRPKEKTHLEKFGFEESQTLRKKLEFTNVV